MSTHPIASSTATVSLSICIPTYNRSASVSRLVQEILQNPSTDIEVVVLDNGSADDTLVRLAAIRDARLSVHSNGSNQGVVFNVLHVLLKARGRHCVLLLDKDRLAPQEIARFTKFLAHNEVACGFCEYGSAQPEKVEVFARGYAALSRIAYTCHHPTGYFFETERLRELDIGRRFIDMDYVGHFCFEFILAELAFAGNAAIYHGPLFSPETLDEAAQQKSFGTNASKEDAFFSPKGRLKIAINFSHHIRTLPISAEQKQLLVTERFVYGLMAATRGYQAIVGSPKLCSHYNMECRRVGRLELLRIAAHFYTQFVAGVFAPCGLRLPFVHAGFISRLGRYAARKWLLRTKARV